MSKRCTENQCAHEWTATPNTKIRCAKCGILASEQSQNPSHSPISDEWGDLPHDRFRMAVAQQGHLRGVSRNGDKAIVISIERHDATWEPVHNGEI